MNAAGRLVHQHALTRHLIMVSLLSRRQLAMMVLLFAVIMSAMGTIYVTYANRVLQADYQHRVVEQGRLQIARGQLLLERSTWLMQARIQQIAENKLGMVLPDHKSAVIIRE